MLYIRAMAPLKVSWLGAVAATKIKRKGNEFIWVTSRRYSGMAGASMYQEELTKS